MARARNIKPGFFENEDLVELPFATRLLFIGLWTLADREGRLGNRPVKIKMALFPMDNVSVPEMLAELSAKKLISIYEANGVGVIKIVNFVKHQAPHGTEKDSDLPDENGFLTVNDRSPTGYITGSRKLVNGAITVNPPNDNALIPDSLIPDSLIPDSLIPDSLIPDSLIPDSRIKTFCSDAAATPLKKVKAQKPGAEKAPTSATWEAYTDAFYARYQIHPDRDAKTNGQLMQVLKRFGAENSPHIVRFYLTLNNRNYIEKRHSVGLLLIDAETIRTNWKLGQGVTATEAMNVDKSANQRAVVDRVVEKFRRQSQEVEA
jgi:hypothetical protein